MIPSAPGYGTSVIRDLIPYELDGKVDYVLAADGSPLQIRDTSQVAAKKNKPACCF